jgi:chromosome segregation ATPase
MATATQVPQRQECNVLEGQIAQLKLKLTDSETELEKLKKELSAVAEAIALDREKPEKVNDISRKIEQCEARVSGFRSVIAAKEENVNALAPEARRIETENRLAARRLELEKLTAEGKEKCEIINAKLLTLIKQDLVQLDSIRDRIAEFRDLGAAQVDESFCRMLTLENGSLAVELPLIHKGNWRHGEIWDLRGDIHLHVRNLRPPKR